MGPELSAYVDGMRSISRVESCNEVEGEVDASLACSSGLEKIKSGLLKNSHGLCTYCTGVNQRLNKGVF